MLLKPYENASDRALIRKTDAVERKLLASALAAVQRIERLDRIVGLLKTTIEEPRQWTNPRHKASAKLSLAHTSRGRKLST